MDLRVPRKASTSELALRGCVGFLTSGACGHAAWPTVRFEQRSNTGMANQCRRYLDTLASAPLASSNRPPAGCCHNS